jgi:hypothetical protein
MIRHIVDMLVISWYHPLSINGIVLDSLSKTIRQIGKLYMHSDTINVSIGICSVRIIEFIYTHLIYQLYIQKN